MKHTTRLAIYYVITIVVFVSASIYSYETSPLNNKQAESTPLETFKECVNRVARHAFVDADVGDTFDAGFDAGLVAAKECSK